MTQVFIEKITKAVYIRRLNINDVIASKGFCQIIYRVGRQMDALPFHPNSSQHQEGHFFNQVEAIAAGTLEQQPVGWDEHQGG